MREYWRDPEGTAAVLQGGWLRSGDLGTMDEDGVARIVGRKKDVIISGGFNVYPEEVEAALSSHPAVLEVAVVGLPHDDWGQTVAAFVVPRPGASVTMEELDHTARTLLSGYKCPRLIEIVSDLPKNASGKIQKGELTRARSVRGP
jgi:acyl-CoA synthetase (AMP-forming)/AMP-acid ligase II